ncbi:MAG: CotH kinase family protein [Burkholderiales bacterium]
MRTMSRLFAAVLATLGWMVEPSLAATTAVEYFHHGFGHYFLTASPQEMAALDASVASGWARTGESFAVFDPGTAGAAPTCRFWTDQAYAPVSSHFYTPLASECAAVTAMPQWRYEGEAFAVTLTEDTGECGKALTPLFRLYNDAKSGAPNHRYTTRAALRTQMIAQGWLPEGAGVGVIACVPAGSAPTLLQGTVVGRCAERARVCADTNRNGRCDPGEGQAYTNAGGAYELPTNGDATTPLVAEVLAAGAACALPADGSTPSYRMASPSIAYSTVVTPYTTLVHLARLADDALAEDLVRAHLGVPPTFAVRLAGFPAAGSLTASVADAVASTLETLGSGLDLTSPSAMNAVIAAFPPALTELPRLRIATAHAAPIESKDVYVDATFVLVNPAAATPAVNLNGKIRGRGNTTWGQPKNPYKVQFANDASYAGIPDVLGMKKQRNWALLADYFDRSLMRNKLALSLGASSVFADGLKWTPAGQHVEVWLNNDYVGVYLLTEDIRIDPARLALRKMSSDPAKGEIDGGYIVEVDFRLDCYRGADLDLALTTPEGVPICVDTPDETAITPAQLAYVKGLLLDVEATLYKDLRLDRMNLPSFSAWYLLQETLRNNDALMISSDFMWKDTAAAANPGDRLLNMGPIWDFDRSAGNVDTFDNWKTEGCWVAKPWLPNWISRMLTNPDFLTATLARWQAKRLALSTFVDGSLDAYARRLAAPAARNFARWPILGLPLTNHYTFSTWEDEVGFLRQFVNDRIAWLDKAFAGKEAFDALCR